MKELLEIQSELKAPKGQYNNFGKYKYRSCEDILEAVKPLLQKHGCTLTLSDDIIEVGGWVYVKATAKLTRDMLAGSELKCIEVTAFAREPESKKGMDTSQITGTASSYARKYALNGLFLIDDTKDADTDENAIEGKARANKAAAQSRKPASTEPEKKEITLDEARTKCFKAIKEYDLELIEMAFEEHGAILSDSFAGSKDDVIMALLAMVDTVPKLRQIAKRTKEESNAL